jgi:predicted nucleic acid-binding protein
MTVIDTTYILPLARIEVTNDLLLAIAQGRIPANQLRLDEIRVNAISIFELQAKAAKLGVKPEYVEEAVGAISDTFKIEAYYTPGVIRTASDLKQEALLSDYIDCIIVATAVELGEKLVTEDLRITKKSAVLKKRYGLEVATFRELSSSTA